MVSVSSVLGTVFGFALVVAAIAVGSPSMTTFLNLEGFLIVIGGTMASAFMGYESNYVVKALKAIGQMLKKPRATRESVHLDILRFVQWALLLHNKGIRALEEEAYLLDDDPLLKFGLELVATGYKPEDVRGMMESAVDAAFERGIVPVTVLRNMASSGPAFGMVGTLVGMVIMLGTIDAQLQSIGQGMAMALLATLYGVVSARLIYLPAAEKLMLKEEMIRDRNQLLLEGLVMLAANTSPRLMQDRLNSYLDPALHFDLDLEMRRAATTPQAA